MSKVKHHRATGKVMGYPDCCIDDFIVRAEQFELDGTVARRRHFAGTGFVPCLVCVGKIDEIGKARFVQEFITPARQVPALP